MIKQLRSFGVLLLFAGCVAGPSGPVSGVSVSTDKTAYARTEEVKIVVRNETGETIFLGTCCTSVSYILEGRSGDVWTEKGRWGIPCLMMCPTFMGQVETGGTYVQAVRLNVGSGTYRLRIPYGKTASNTTEQYLYSNEFTIG